MPAPPLRPYIIWFSAAFAMLTALSAAAAWVWPEIGNALALPSLLGAALGASAKFAMDNERPFSDEECRHMTRMSFLITWGISIFASLGLIAAQVGLSQLGAFLQQIWWALQSPPINGAIAAGALAFIAALTYGVLYLCYGRMSRKFAEQQRNR